MSIQLNSMTPSPEEINKIDSVGLDIGRLWLNDLYSDVEFLVEDQRLPGHRMILATRSEYFRALLYGGMVESREREIRIELPVNAFKLVLGYIYMGILPLSMDVKTILDVLDIAHLYGLQNVETAIKTYSEKNLDISNVCTILDAMLRNHFSRQTKECLQFMELVAYDIVKHFSFQKLSKESLETILRRDSFCAPEKEIFRAVCKWRDNNPSEDIKTVLSLIRLPLMSIDDLVNVVQPSGMFELNTIFDAIKGVIAAKRLPYRKALLPDVDVISDKYIPLLIKSNKYKHVIELSNLFLINLIKTSIHISCSVEVSCDQTRWDHVGSFISAPYIRFKDRYVRYIRFEKISEDLNPECRYEAFFTTEAPESPELIWTTLYNDFQSLNV